MAKLKLGAMLGDARNAIGGMVFSKNQFGAYARQKVSPVQPRSIKQAAVRSGVQDLATKWANQLTAAQRAGWIALASVNPVVDVFGDSQILTGLQMFVRVNRNLIKAGQDYRANPPANQDVDALSTLTVAASVATQAITLTFTPTPIGALNKLLEWATPALPKGRAYHENFYKFLAASAANAPTGVDIGPAWVLRFGAMQLGQQIGVKCRLLNVDTGAESAALQATCEAGA